MLEVYDFAILGLMGFFTVILGAYVSYRVVKPRLEGRLAHLKKEIRGEALNIGNQVGKQIAEVVENVDVSEIIGQVAGVVPGAEGGAGGLEALAGMAGVDLGPLGALAKIGGGQAPTTTKNPFLK